jgi:hypothetical protein
MAPVLLTVSAVGRLVPALPPSGLPPSFWSLSAHEALPLQPRQRVSLLPMGRPREPTLVGLALRDAVAVEPPLLPCLSRGHTSEGFLIEGF